MGRGWRGYCLGDTQVGYTNIESKLPMGSLQRWRAPRRSLEAMPILRRSPEAPRRRRSPRDLRIQTRDLE